MNRQECPFYCLLGMMTASVADFNSYVVPRQVMRREHAATTPFTRNSADATGHNKTWAGKLLNSSFRYAGNAPATARKRM
jgi:hypothetical protein